MHGMSVDWCMVDSVGILITKILVSVSLIFCIEHFWPEGQTNYESFFLERYLLSSKESGLLSLHHIRCWLWIYRMLFRKKEIEFVHNNRELTSINLLTFEFRFIFVGNVGGSVTRNEDRQVHLLNIRTQGYKKYIQFKFGNFYLMLWHFTFSTRIFPSSRSTNDMRALFRVP